MQALLGYTSENRWIRYAHAHLAEQFPAPPGQPGYNNRLRRLNETMAWLITVLREATQVGDDYVWVIDSTPVECARSKETVRRSQLAGYAEYGYCASHSRFSWGFRLHLVCTLRGMPIGWAITRAKADEREALLSILSDTPRPATGHRQLAIADKNYFGHRFDAATEAADLQLLCPARKGEPERAGPGFSSPYGK